MSLKYLHQTKDFPKFIRDVSLNLSIDPVLIEKDYWLMHCLYGLQQMELSFELKGGTSLSKGLGIIERFSEDIDIRIEPPADQNVATNPKKQTRRQVESRRYFYDWLAKTIRIDGIIQVERDHDYDDTPHYRNGGITLRYDSQMGELTGVRGDVLLEVGFDTVTPNTPHTISSWVYDYAAENMKIIDNRAIDVACYHPGYTFVEKLCALSSKYRKQQQEGIMPDDFMRHYYDVYRLLQEDQVRAFIGTEAYAAHKRDRFRNADNPILAENEAFVLSDPRTRKIYSDAYENSGVLFYWHSTQPPFEDIMAAITEAVKIEGI